MFENSTEIMTDDNSLIDLFCIQELCELIGLSLVGEVFNVGRFISLSVTFEFWEDDSISLVSEYGNEGMVGECACLLVFFMLFV